MWAPAKLCGRSWADCIRLKRLDLCKSYTSAKAIPVQALQSSAKGRAPTFVKSHPYANLYFLKQLHLGYNLKS
jgi:hypothetical protein